MNTVTGTVDKGFDPHLTYCPICKGNAEELTIGTVLKYYGEETDILLGFGHPGGALAHELIRQEVSYRTEAVGEAERLPAGGPCPDCRADIMHQRLEFEEEIKKGGAFWSCQVCGKYGVVVHNDSVGFCAALRGQTGIAPPNYLEVKFVRCEQHASEGDKGKWLN